jgi:hypothetical protein
MTEWIINWRGCERKQSWRNLWCYPGTHLEGLRGTIKKKKKSSRQRVFVPRFESGTFRVRSTSGSHSFPTLSSDVKPQFSLESRSSQFCRFWSYFPSVAHVHFSLILDFHFILISTILCVLFHHSKLFHSSLYIQTLSSCTSFYMLAAAVVTHTLSSCPLVTSGHSVRASCPAESILKHQEIPVFTAILHEIKHQAHFLSGSTQPIFIPIIHAI